MSTLREVGESQMRLAGRRREFQVSTDSVEFRTTYTVREDGKVRAFARASLLELGFREPPCWGAVMRRVRKLGKHCRPADVQKLQAQLNELADVIRPVMKPSKGKINVCHGGGVLLHSVQAPFHRLMLDTEVVFEKVA